MREVMGQIQFSMDKMLESQAGIESKLDAALARLGGDDYSSCKYAPEDPKAFWNEYFGGDKVIPVELFVPVFEEEFTPEDVDELDSAVRDAMVGILDAYPCDGVVSIVEWKKFCKAATKSGKSLYGFVMSLAES